MKKILLILLVLSYGVSSAQFTVTKLNGTPILNGDIITFNVATNPQSSLDFKVYNTTAAPILTKIQFVSATNYNGTNFQLCYGTDCIDNIVVGQSYPNPAFEIPANGQNSNFDHFLNTNAGDGTNYPMDFVFKFFTVDATGAEIGTPLTFTYRFDPTLSNSSFDSDLKNIGVELKNTIVENYLEFNTENNISFEIFDINGKMVSSTSYESGNNQIDLSFLSSNIYFLNITDENQRKVNTKIIKK